MAIIGRVRGHGGGRGPAMISGMLLALDVGGTKTVAWACGQDGRTSPPLRLATPEDPDAGIAMLRQLGSRLAAGRHIAGIGVSIGGPIDRRAGTVSPLHQPAWRGLPLAAILSEALLAPVEVEVDTDGAALAESLWGGHGLNPLLYLTVSTGIGGGVVAGGAIQRGVDGAHPEVGHVLVPTGLPPAACACGSADCLEALVSGRALERRHAKPCASLDDAAWRQAGTWLGCGLASIVTCLAPAVVVVGGGVAVGAGSRLLAPAAAELDRRLRLVPRPPLRLAALGYASAPAGALALAARAAGRPRPRLDPEAIRAAAIAMQGPGGPS